MIGLKRKISKYFDVINFDEFRTSCLDWRTEKYNNNVNIKYNKNGLLKTKKLHAVLVSDIPTLNSSICKKSFQNRDRNSVLNIRKLTHYYLETKERIERYKRGIKLSN